jgi:hypothetical protein
MAAPQEAPATAGALFFAPGRRRSPTSRGVPAVLLALLLAACAAPQTDALRGAGGAGATEGLHRARELGSVPFYAQERDQCGPAALAMALSASGATVTPESLRAALFVPGRSGTLAPEMLAAGRRHGRLAVRLAPTVVAVLREVDAGNPVIVLQNLGLPVFPVWHYALVIGYDLDRDRIVLHSGPQEREQMSLAQFERTWARSGYWAMVATAPQAPPVTPAVDDLVEAAAALEAVDARAAFDAYGALAARAPQDFGLWMGMGNSAYALADLPGAAEAFARATRLQPQNADAWNNLAAARLAQGDLPGARAAIDRALALRGTHRDVVQQTAADIERAEHAAPSR